MFVLPDNVDPLRRSLRRADDRVFVAGYTFTDPTDTRLLIDPQRRSVDVWVVLEGGPVGGISDEQVRAIERLQAGGTPVSLIGTSRARYEYHHAKGAVVHETVIVTSEIWKPGGIGGHGSRGWAVRL